MTKKYSFNSILCSAFLVSAFSCQPLLAHVNIASLGAAPSRASHYKSEGYVGAQVGLSHMKARMSDVYDAVAIGSVRASNERSGSDTAFLSEILLGGRYLFSNGFFPGIEVAASFSKNRINHDLHFTDPGVPVSVQINTKFERSNVIIPSLVLGWAFKNNFHVFAKFGVGISNFKTRVTAINDVFGLITPRVEFSNNVTRYSFAPSVGLEYAISRYFSVIGSVNYEKYKEIKFNQRDLVPLLGGGDTNVVTVKPWILTSKIGLLFRL